MDYKQERTSDHPLLKNLASIQEQSQIHHTSHNQHDTVNPDPFERRRINTAVFYKMKQIHDSQIRQEEHLAGYI